ncbi:ISNCY family transposase [Spiroplasma tabanidicola]|uniref:ISNCY family transposase n=1 Tax=Spiroplasma tabanidicola TaxID=324079 RepID=A0A6I6C8Z7_9MOLU|nr:DDE-type integrase/transposase/recombinase [Spiroplasma tabanidicola]QGS51929.1 ISNCY family transposase [Spiroplasma tabanidicola]
MKENNELVFSMHKKTKKEIRLRTKRLNNDLDPLVIIKNKIPLLKHPHPTQKRETNFGAIFEADASNHEWIKGVKSHLHIVIDKSTKIILAGHFSEQEKTESYYRVYKETFVNYGIPIKNVTDNRNVFSSKINRDSEGYSESRTQLQFIFHSLKVSTKTTSIPQEKALVERTFGTLQRRWPQRIRIKNIKTIEELNDYLPTLIKEYNKKYSTPIDNCKSVVRKFTENPNIVFSYRTTRIVNKGSSIDYDNKNGLFVQGMSRCI